MKVQILISTMNERLFNLSFDESLAYVIVHQITNGDPDAYKCYIDDLVHNYNISYFAMHDIGLSKSRNKALEMSTADYVWVMDDDTKIIEGSCSIIENYFTTHKVDFISVPHYMGSKLVQKKKKDSKVNMLNAAKISSINMVISRQCIDSGVQFDEHFGLGSNLPSGEEYIYITDLLKKGFIGMFTDIKGCIHLDDESSGYDFYSNETLILSKLKMFKRIFPKSYLLLVALFILKKLDKFICNIPALYKSILRLVR